MRFTFLTFETILAGIWFWAAFWMFGLLAQHDGDWGTLIGALVFLILGVGTAIMLINEFYQMLSHRKGSSSPTAQSLAAAQHTQQRAVSEE